jgi:hypothetical protein
VSVGRWAAVFAITGALVACRAKPRPEPPAPPAAERPGAPAPEASEREPAPSPTGDRHARAAARRSHLVKRTTGKLARADERVLVIGDGSGAAPLTLRIAPGTAVTLDGEPARPEALPPGAEVRAAYRTGDGGRPTAITVEVRRAPGAVPPPPAPAAPATAPSPAAPAPAPEDEPSPEPSGG